MLMEEVQEKETTVLKDREGVSTSVRDSFGERE